jgi:TolA-binding protein
MRQGRVLLVALGLSVLTVSALAAGSGGRKAPSAAPRATPAHGPVDPEVQKGLDAFSQRRYALARSIAEGLFKQRNRGSTHAEAMDLLVESWLAQGKFAEARTAAKQYSQQAPKESQDALKRIGDQERDYQAKLKQYQADRVKAKKPEAQARALLHIGHLHHLYGRMDLAEAAYREVVTKYPKTVAASRAQRQLDALHGKPQHALKGPTKSKAKRKGAGDRR